MSIRSRDLSAFYELMYNPNYTPSRSEEAHIERLEVDGQPTYVLMKESAGEYYEVDDVTNRVWDLLDGKRSVKTIYNELAKEVTSLSERDVRDIIATLAEEGTIESTEPETEQKRVEVVSGLQINVQLLRDCSESLAGFFRVTRKLGRKGELPIAVIIVILGVILFAGTFVHIFSNTSIFDIGGSALIGLLFYQLLVLAPVYAIHELSHAAACDYYGGRPKALGTGLYYLAPFFYVDTTDSWRLPRRARIMISLAGPLVELVTASFVVVWSYFVAPSFLKNVLQIIAFLCFYGSLLNLSPILETDGYYILSDVVKMPNLRDEASAYLKRIAFRILGRPASARRVGFRQRRIFLAFAAISIIWSILFAYTTLGFLHVYGADAYHSLTILIQMAIRAHPFDAATVGVNIAALAYFALFIAGFAVMGAVSYRKVRMRGVRLETIHDKRVSVFMPVPSFTDRQQASELVGRAEKAAAKLSRSHSVTLEPPLCVASLKLGLVDQSMDDMRAEMLKVEQAFRSVHDDFLSRILQTAITTRRKDIGDGLVALAGQFPTFERKGAEASASQLFARQEVKIRYLLQSAFGTLWTLELSPDDYKRIRREIFPNLIAEDLCVTDFPDELEVFKKQTVLGADTIAQLSSEIEKESKEVNRKPELYQLTAFLEPVKSRLVFIGRTDRVEGAVVWLGGLFLYQAWTSYISEVLEGATLGLKSIRLAPSVAITKSQTGKLTDWELGRLDLDLDRMEQLTKAVEESKTNIASTFESAKNFHEALASLVSDESFDIGLYKPILRTNERHLEGIRERIEAFQAEFGRIRAVLDASAAEVSAELDRRTPGAMLRRSRLRTHLGGLFSGRLLGAGSRSSPVFDREVKLMFAMSRLLYEVVICSDIVL